MSDTEMDQKELLRAASDVSALRSMEESAKRIVRGGGHLRATQFADMFLRVLKRTRDAQPVSVTVCGGTPTPEAQAELDDFARWLGLPKPRPEFRAWRRDGSKPHLSLDDRQFVARRSVEQACEIIETADERLLAVDGPCGGLPPDMSLKEWRDLYVKLTDARSALRSLLDDQKSGNPK